MDKVCLFVICMYCSIHHLSAQQEEQQTQPVQQSLVTQDDILGNMNVDYAKIKLPPLSVLYENARSTPSLQILQKKLLSKEKRNWLGFIQAGGSASYGIADNVASNTDVNTPLIYRYVGTEQTSGNVGGGISIPFEKLFDLRGGIKRQRIQVDIAELRKQEAYETLKIQIAHLYVQILSNIETLQRSAENIALYKGASAVAEQEYRNRRTSIHDVAKTKEQEFAANQDFALLRSTINDQLLTLYRIRWWMVIFPCIAGIIAWFLTRSLEKTYDVKTTIFTGIISGYNVDATDTRNATVHMSNLMNIITTERTLKIVSLKLLARCLVYGDAERNTSYISAIHYQQLVSGIPRELQALIDKRRENLS